MDMFTKGKIAYGFCMTSGAKEKSQDFRSNNYYCITKSLNMRKDLYLFLFLIFFKKSNTQSSLSQVQIPMEWFGVKEGL